MDREQLRMALALSRAGLCGDRGVLTVVAKRPYRRRRWSSPHLGTQGSAVARAGACVERLGRARSVFAVAAQAGARHRVCCRQAGGFALL